MSEQSLVDLLAGAIDSSTILRSNQVSALDPGVEQGNTAASVAVRPRNAAEVSAVLKVCNEQRIAVVTHGGRTGLAGAAVSEPGQLILLTDRLEGGIVIDETDRVAVVSSSVTQQALQEAAAGHGLSLGIDTASRGSATIGGMISTNAGGMEAFRYGMTRQRLLGIEAVTADGTIISDLTRVSKANEAYDLKQLLCGAEGTLGVVTRAVLKLEKAPAPGSTTLLAVPGAAAALRLMRAVQEQDGLLLCELMWRAYAASVARETGLTHVLSFCEQAPAYLVVESTLPQDRLLATFAPFFDTGDILDAVLAKSQSESRDIWRIREDSQATLRVMPNPLSFDVSVPLGKLDEYVERLQHNLQQMAGDIEFHSLAHLADGNLHLNFARAQVWTKAESEQISLWVEQGIKEMGGAVSAEHGIGTHKLDMLVRNLPAGNLQVMQSIKTALDPNGILNPGKVLPAAQALQLC